MNSVKNDNNLNKARDLIDTEDRKHILDVEFYDSNNIKRAGLDNTWVGNLLVEKAIESSLPIKLIYKKPDCTIIHFHNRMFENVNDKYEIITIL